MVDRIVLETIDLIRMGSSPIVRSLTGGFGIAQLVEYRFVAPAIRVRFPLPSCLIGVKVFSKIQHVPL
jgi:hypothetical protein